MKQFYNSVTVVLTLVSLLVLCFTAYFFIVDANIIPTKYVVFSLLMSLYILMPLAIMSNMLANTR